MSRCAVPVAAAAVAILLSLACKKEADITLSGSIAGIHPGDSVFVTLSRDWDHGVEPPISFSIDEDGRFTMRFVISGAPKPVTFVKNKQLLARLEFKDAWGYAPTLTNKASGREFPVQVVAEGTLKASVALP